MFSLFSNKDKKKKQMARSHINALWEILLADGRTHANELKMLYERANYHKLTKKEVDAITINRNEISANKDDIPFIKPETVEERFHFIYDLTCMMMIDGDIDYREKEMCKDYALRLGFQRNFIDELIDSLTKNIGSVSNLNEMYRKLYPIIKKLKMANDNKSS
ncbi:hypothetical protein [Reichenbachiella sp. MALMAid0571]|uniref:hypothetical protein n=1 Tax=Reichenbachiella sp. MALMAid0571 TaxID=3143939 RepID=UPI0032DFA660